MASWCSCLSVIRLKVEMRHRLRASSPRLSINTAAKTSVFPPCLCVSVVKRIRPYFTTEAQRRRGKHREETIFPIPSSSQHVTAQRQVTAARQGSNSSETHFPLRLVSTTP